MEIDDEEDGAKLCQDGDGAWSSSYTEDRLCVISPLEVDRCCH